MATSVLAQHFLLLINMVHYATPQVVSLQSGVTGICHVWQGLVHIPLHSSHTCSLARLSFSRVAEIKLSLTHKVQADHSHNKPSTFCPGIHPPHPTPPLPSL